MLCGAPALRPGDAAHRPSGETVRNEEKDERRGAERGMAILAAKPSRREESDDRGISDLTTMSAAGVPMMSETRQRRPGLPGGESGSGNSLTRAPAGRS